MLSNLPKRLWMLPLFCLGLTVLSIAQGAEIRRTRAPATLERPVYASEKLSNPLAITSGWERAPLGRERETSPRLAALPILIDQTGARFEASPDSFRRAYLKR